MKLCSYTKRKIQTYKIRKKGSTALSFANLGLSDIFLGMFRSAAYNQRMMQQFLGNTSEGMNHNFSH